MTERELLEELLRRILRLEVAILRLRQSADFHDATMGMEMSLEEHTLNKYSYLNEIEAAAKGVIDELDN